MKVVVDTNIVFSAFLSKNSKYRELLFDDKYEFYSPTLFAGQLELETVSDEQIEEILGE